MTNDGWRAISDLVVNSDISYGIVQPGAHVKNGVPIVRAGDIARGKIAASSPLRVAPEVAASFRRTSLLGGEVLVSLVGSVGNAAVVNAELAGWNVARAVAVLRPKNVESRWLAWAMELPEVQRQIRAVLNTTVQPTLNLGDLKGVTVPVADPKTMRGVAEVLGAFDDKIGANRRVIESADGLLRAAYESLRRGTRTHVPLGKVARSIRRAVQPHEGAGVYLGLEHLPRRLSWTSDAGDRATVTSAKVEFAEGDVLLGKLRPYFHKVVSAPTNGIASSDILVVRPIEPSHFGRVLMACTHDDTIERLSTVAEGTRMPRAKWQDLAETLVPVGETTEFDALSATLDRSCKALVRESARLATSRDELLPLLMSSKLSVKDAEKRAEEVL